MSSQLIPGRESELVTKVQIAAEVITAQYAQYYIPQLWATQFQEDVDNFVQLHQNANNESTKSPTVIIAKDEAKKGVIKSYRWLNKNLQNNEQISNLQRAAVGCPIYKTSREPSKPIDEAPKIDELTMNGHRMTFKVHSDSSLRARAAGAKGLSVLTHVGETVPALDKWTFETNTTKNEIVIDFDPSLPLDTKVWVCCFWVNNLMESSPACLPRPAYITRPSEEFLTMAA